MERDGERVQVGNTTRRLELRVVKEIVSMSGGSVVIREMALEVIRRYLAPGKKLVGKRGKGQVPGNIGNSHTMVRYVGFSFYQSINNNSSNKFIDMQYFQDTLY